MAYRDLFFPILLSLFGVGVIIILWVPLGMYTDYIFFESRKHIHQGNCTISSCNITSKICDYDWCINNDYNNCTEHIYTCYGFFANITFENFTKKYWSGYDKSGYYPTPCNKNITTCYYCDLDTYTSLTLEPINPPSTHAWWAIIITISLMTVGLFSCIVSFSMDAVKTYKKMQDYEIIREEEDSKL